MMRARFGSLLISVCCLWACSGEQQVGESSDAIDMQAGDGSAGTGPGPQIDDEPGSVRVVEDDGVHDKPLSPSTAAFAVRLEGDGTGRVTSSPAGIDCGEDASVCDVVLPLGTEITLTAEATAGHRFGGFSGIAGCGAEPVCVFTLDEDRSATAVFLHRELVLDVVVTGDGSGRVTSDPSGISCGEDCTQSFARGTAVRLQAVADESSTFLGFDGPCEGLQPCDLTLEVDQRISAEFALRRLTVVTRSGGDGSGQITLRRADGAVCASPCEVDYGTELRVEAMANPGATFAGFNGACSGTALPCVLEVTEDAQVEAVFSRTLVPVAVTLAGQGRGRVTSAPSGIDCGSACTALYTYGTEVTLSAQWEAASSTFMGWEGDCSGTQATCRLNVEAARNARARFNLINRTLTVATNGGAGAGTVTGVVSGPNTQVINCGSACSDSAPHGTRTVVLTATANTATSSFVSWEGCPNPSGATCTVAMDASRTVTARFDLLTRTLNVATNGGAGAGTVTGVISGPNTQVINCGSACSDSAPHGTRTIVLTATANTATSSFVSWAGCPNPSGATCTVPMDASRTVTARFDLLTRTLTVRTSGGGTVNGVLTGTNTSVIQCGGNATDCTERRVQGTQITLTPSYNATTTTFTGWTGACSGTSRTCIVTLDGTDTVAASFVPREYTLTLTLQPRSPSFRSVRQRVVSVPSGIDISGPPYPITQTINVRYGTQVTLDAEDSGIDWTGCTPVSGDPSNCRVTVTGNTSVTGEVWTIL